jgi:hypothetical protein
MNDEIKQQMIGKPDDFRSSVRRIIANLRSIVDQFGTNSKELGIKLTRKLDGEKICEKNKISRLIKYTLNDKIRGRKITSRRIEDYLSEDYKSRYGLGLEISRYCSCHNKNGDTLERVGGSTTNALSSSRPSIEVSKDD